MSDEQRRIDLQCRLSCLQPASVYRLRVLLPLPWWLGARPLPNHGLDERVGRFVFILPETWTFLGMGESYG